MFFYVTAIVFIFGAELNAVWREETGRRPAPREAGSEAQDAEDGTGHVSPSGPHRNDDPTTGGHPARGARG
jgi:hypothetical protein